MIGICTCRELIRVAVRPAMPAADRNADSSLAGFRRTSGTANK